MKTYEYKFPRIKDEWKNVVGESHKDAAERATEGLWANTRCDPSAFVVEAKIRELDSQQTLVFVVAGERGSGFTAKEVASYGVLSEREENIIDCCPCGAKPISDTCSCGFGDS